MSSASEARWSPRAAGRMSALWLGSAMLLAAVGCSKKISPNNPEPFPDLHVTAVTPGANAANVASNTDIVITFSSQMSLSNLGVVMAPLPADFYANMQLSADRRQVTSRVTLAANTVYSVAVFAARDRFDDYLRVPIVSHFSTGGTLPAGRVLGKAAAPFNDPNRVFVGLLRRQLQAVLAAEAPDAEFAAHLAAVSVVGDTSGTFEMQNVAPGTYWPFAALDVDRDGRFSLQRGDRLQGYDAGADLVPDSVVVAAAPVSGISLSLPVEGMRVQSISPANGSRNVPLQTAFNVTFSAPVDTNRLGLFVAPIPAGLSRSNLQLSADGRSLSAAVTLQPNTTYTAVLYAATSTRGLTLPAPVQVQFTTGAEFPTGGVSGRAVFAAGAGTPKNALVGLLNTSIGSVLIRILVGRENPTEVLRSTLVAISYVPEESGDFTLAHVPDGTYWPAGAKDEDLDGGIEPPAEPIGFYSSDGSTSITDADSLVIRQGAMLQDIQMVFLRLGGL